MTRSTTNPSRADASLLRIRTPDDAAVAVPYLLGYHPHDSMVVLPFGPPAVRRGGTAAPVRGPAVMRVDLPQRRRVASDLDPWCANFSDVIAVGGSAAVLIAYTEDHDLAHVIVNRLEQRLAERGVRVAEALRVAEGRWWSFSCADKGCCPAEGVQFDPSTSLIAAQAAFDGRIALANRADLAAQIKPVEGPARRRLTAAFAQAYAELRDEEDGTGPAAVDERARTLVREVLQQWRSGLVPLSDSSLARLAVRVARIPVRDEAWRLIRDPWRATHRSLWAEVVRRAEPPFDVAPACLLAVAAYLDGDGTMARIALDRALDRNPRYSMALLLHEMLDRMIPPGEMRDLIESLDPSSMAEAGSDD